jgi:hypothetical protein
MADVPAPAVGIVCEPKKPGVISLSIRHLFGNPVISPNDGERNGQLARGRERLPTKRSNRLTSRPGAPLLEQRLGGAQHALPVAASRAHVEVVQQYADDGL